ncbi:PREDICTED: phospholipid-metabolizing enzyme A-C1-like [Lepidothrix coronata]|uniref:Phospholipid-metabolizing enzyme A-C1-like n=1 Tax=Lepidothrix coronata TaxID=321398 RepID=A0A6J0GWH9_9PASS|nr:PREDICTED: phospholipid-metabolizing enzyme A-C1-like [Lepidothrix coronata]
MSRHRHQPEPGDLIEIKRSVYQHWALYLGDGYVVHLTSADEGIRCLSASSDTTLSKKAKVKKQLLKEVVGTDDWEVNNKYDRSRTPLPVKEIIKRAESYIGMEMTYNVFCENCEHFVTMLRYGESVSDQAKIGVGSMLALGTGIVASAVIAVACAAFGSPRDKSREKK